MRLYKTMIFAPGELGRCSYHRSQRNARATGAEFVRRNKGATYSIKPIEIDPRPTLNDVISLLNAHGSTSNV